MTSLFSSSSALSMYLMVSKHNGVGLSGKGFRKKLLLSLLRCSAMNFKLFSSGENDF